jgi:hypothetical protein
MNARWLCCVYRKRIRACRLWASNNIGQVWWRPWERPEIAIEEVVKFGATATASAIANNGYSEFEHTRPAGLGMRTAMNADKINI